MKKFNRPTMLMILDGYGLNKETAGNAIAAADKPHLDDIFAKYPSTSLKACGLDVGLPEGQMGNSEVGHLNIGAGRIVYQDLTMITKAIEDGSFFENKAFLKAVDHVKKNGSTLHLLGLLSDGGVHSHINHLLALVDLAKKHDIEKLCVHCFLDGRDVPPRCAQKYIDILTGHFEKAGIGTLGVISGRYYAMDGDAMIMFNFRPDRAREITRTFVDKDFDGFDRKKKVSDICYICMTQYDAEMPDVTLAFPPETLHNTLGEYIASLGLTQLRIAETEKYAHVTFFFNGGVEAPNRNEDRILIPSPKVATYDMQPEMSAYEVTDKVLEAIDTDKYDLIILNFANADMVGHTGVMKAAVEAIETLDKCVPKIADAILAKDGQILLTADHGNADVMLDKDGNVVTAHSLNDVPLVHIANHPSQLKDGGRLSDIAPTILKLMGLDIPEEMTGKPLV